MSYWTMDDHIPVPCNSSAEWDKWLATADCRVNSTRVGGVEVVTIFMGDYEFPENSDGRPLLFKTTIIGGPFDRDENFYATWTDAESGHKGMVDAVAHELGIKHE